MGCNNSILINETKEIQQIYPPYHCPNCKYIWDEGDKFDQHLDYCIWDPDSLQYFAKTQKIDKFDDSDKIIPKNRCRCIMKSGHRIGKVCLRKEKLDTPGYCKHHIPI